MINILHKPHRMKNYYQEADNLRFFRRIKNYSYDQEKQILSITFQSGTTQNYCKVPGRVYKEMESSPDQNEYYDKNIYGNYQLGRLDLPAINQCIRSMEWLVNNKK